MKHFVIILVILVFCSCFKTDETNEFNNYTIKYVVEVDSLVRVRYHTADDVLTDTIIGDWQHEFQVSLAYGNANQFGCVVNPYGLSDTMKVSIDYFVNGIKKHTYKFPTDSQLVVFTEHVWLGSAIFVP